MMLTPKQFVDLRHMHDTFHAGARARNYEVWFPKLLDQVEALQANQKILVDALEKCRQGAGRCSDTADIAYIAREALEKTKEA